MSALGSLVVKLALEYAEYTRGLDKGSQEALKFGQKTQKAFDQAAKSTSDYVSGTVRNLAVAGAAYIGVTSVLDKFSDSIDSLGKLDDLSQKTGSAVESLSRLLKVQRQYGGDQDLINTSLNKLAKGMATVDSETNKTNKALGALGLSAKDSAGNLRDPSQVLIDVAKRLQDYKDGAAKAALATDLFGKSGAELLPYLNDVADNVDKFTGVSAQAAARAAEFQDQLGGLRVKSDELFQGLAIALIPVLSDVTDAITGTSKSSTDLANNNAIESWADGVAMTFASLADNINNAAAAYHILTTSIGAGGAITYAILNPTIPWKEAQQAVASIKADAGAEIDRLLKSEDYFQKKLTATKNIQLNYSGNARAVQADYAGYSPEVQRQAQIALAAASGFNVGSPYVSPNSDKKNLDYTTGNAPAEKVSDYEKLTQSINEKIAASQRELAIGQPLSDSEKLLVKLYSDRATGAIKITNAEQAVIETSIKKLGVLDQQNEQEKQVQKTMQASQDEYYKQLDSIQQSIDSTQLQVDTYGLLPSAITAATIAKLENRKAYLESIGVEGEAIQRINEQIDAYTRLAQAQGNLEFKDKLKKYDQDAKDAADKLVKDADDAAKRMAESFNQSLTDAIFRGFEAGKGFARNFRDTLINTFKSLILRPLVSFIVDSTGVGAAAASIFSGSAQAGTSTAAGSSGGGFGSLLTTGSKLYDGITNGFSSLNDTFVGSISKLGASIANGQGGLADAIGGTMGQYSSQIAYGLAYLPAAISLLKGDIKSAAFQGVGAAIGSIWGPAGAAIGSMIGGFVGSLFGGHVSRPKYYANTAVSASGNSTINAYGNSDAKGTGGGVAINAGLGLGAAVGQYATAFGGSITSPFTLGVDYQKKYNSYGVAVGNSITKNGANADFRFAPSQSAAAAADVFLTAVKKGFVTLPEYLQNIVKRSTFDINTAQGAVDALGAYMQLNAALKDLPPIFNSIGDAIKNVASTNNLDAIKARFSAINTYTALFYSDQEKLSTFTKQLNTQFNALDVSLPGTRDGFRSLVDGIDTTTASGLSLFNTLIDLSPTMDTYYKALQSQADVTAQAADSAKQLADALSTDNFATLVDYTRAQRYIQNGLSTTGIPGFASGGDFEGGLRIVGENGPELEATGPSRIINHNDLMSSLKNPSAGIEVLANEIRQLRQENQALQLQIVIATQKTAKMMTKFDDVGIVLSETNNSGTRVVLDTRTVP